MGRNKQREKGVINSTRTFEMVHERKSERVKNTFICQMDFRLNKVLECWNNSVFACRLFGLILENVWAQMDGRFHSSRLDIWLWTSQKPLQWGTSSFRNVGVKDRLNHTWYRWNEIYLALCLKALTANLSFWRSFSNPHGRHLGTADTEELRAEDLAIWQPYSRREIKCDYMSRIP